MSYLETIERLKRTRQEGRNPALAHESLPEKTEITEKSPSCPGPDVCAGCYSVGVIDGRERFIHPPKASADWLSWRKRYEISPKTERFEMQTAAQIIEGLAELGVTVRANGDRLRLEPASRIPPALRVRVREAKAALLETLRKRPATCAASCYEIELGRWRHYPGDGCRTFLAGWKPPEGMLAQ